MILDHAPHVIAGKPVAEAIGIEIRNVSTYDKGLRDPAVDSTKATTILFTRSNNLIGNNELMKGVDSVVTVTGSSLVGPVNSKVLLHLSSTATDEDWLPETKNFRYRSAAGRTQGSAFELGKGRVIVLGEAAMVHPDNLSIVNRGNWNMTLNILKWLTKVKS